MSVLEDIKAAAKAACPVIVLSEGEDPRIVAAAERAAAEGLAQITLLGSPAEIKTRLTGQAPAGNLKLEDPTTSERLGDYAQSFHALRKSRGVSAEDAIYAVRSPLIYAALMVANGHADGTISGAVATTADTVRAALRIIGRAPGVDVVSSCFLMLLGQPFSRPVIFADCGLIMQPTAEELASIAISSSESLRALTGREPRVAMLSFSTMGSVTPGAHESIERIHRAIGLVRERAPELVIDGEIQFVAAIIPDTAEIKAFASPVAGRANVFVFPSLSAGNIGYKIAQRLGGALALGPILQGLAHPANDLSRGCSAEDVYQMIAITAAQTKPRTDAAVAV